jgi:hypothetical protein
MSFPADEMVVTDLVGDIAKVVASKKEHEKSLGALGFRREHGCLVKSIASDADRLAIAKELVVIGAVFSIGHGWSPAEFLGFCREDGHVLGKYRVIAWRSPTDYVIRVEG